MIISPGRRYIFVHIPKTGGTSMALALEAWARADDILIGDTPKALRRRHRLKGLKADGRIWKHSRLADINGLDGIGRIDRFFVFTLVRDPWDRIFGLYHWLRAQDFAHPAVGVAKNASFETFLSDPEIGAMLAADGASSYVTDAAGIRRCDAFVRLEHLEADLEPVEHHLGFRLFPLPHANRSDRPADSRAFYSGEAARRVSRWFASDIARFGYRF